MTSSASDIGIMSYGEDARMSIVVAELDITNPMRSGSTFDDKSKEVSGLDVF